jgi:pilus assembly protein Flp/PilA
MKAKLVAAARKCRSAVRNLFVREEGASLVEYGLLLALIAVVCIVAVTQLGTKIQNIFTQIAAAL